MDVTRVTVVAAPERNDVQALDDGLFEFNASSTGIRDARLMAIFVRDDPARIVAGLYGWTWGGCCEVDKLWVHEDWRRRGIGTRLMQAAEAEARVRGAFQMIVATHSFQAPAFYHRLGFETVGALDDYPRGHQKLFLRKRWG